jgi:hypothetical protein
VEAQGIAPATEPFPPPPLFFQDSGGIEGNEEDSGGLNGWR